MHSLHLSFIIFPSPLHSSHWVWVCIIIGPCLCTIILIPVPLHFEQVVFASGFDKPVPLHFGHIILLSYSTSFLPPLYESSKVMLNSTNFALHFLFTFWLDLERNGPNPPKKSNGSNSAPPPSFNPSSPYLSYISLFFGSLNTSYAFCISLNFSGSPPLSGWSLITNFLCALRISSGVAFFETPIML